MPEVKFSAYRQYLEQRQTINSAVMALLAGSQLASHTLQLTAGSDRNISEIFPQVKHIPRFSLKTDKAQELLANAEAHLSAMAIPYIISIHESLFDTFEDMLTASGALPARNKRFGSPVWVVKEHWENLSQPSSPTLDQPSWQLFTLLNELRHDLIHRAGVIGQRTVEADQQLSPQARSLWHRMAGTAMPVLVLGDTHKLDHNDMIVALAVVKFLANEGNNIMQTIYPRALWLADFAKDVVVELNLQGNIAQRVRKAKSFARFYYDALKFSEQDIRAALEAL